MRYESVGVINGLQHLPAQFTPGARRGASLDDTVALWQQRIDDEGLARPITVDG